MKIATQHPKRQRGFAGQNMIERLLLNRVSLQRGHIAKRNTQHALLIKPYLANPALAFADQAPMSARETPHRATGFLGVEFSILCQLIQHV